MVAGLIVAAAGAAANAVRWLWTKPARRAAEATRARRATQAAAPADLTSSRYPGASSAARGAPLDTLLLVDGIDSLTPSARAALLEAAELVGVPVDSLAVALAYASRMRPELLNPYPAAGIMQITAEAGLPGLDSDAAIRAVTGWSAEEQIRRVVAPYFLSLGPQIEGAGPGAAILANFRPDVLGQPETTILGDRAAPPGSLLRRAYDLKSYMDENGDGLITIGDVYAAAARVVARAETRRIDVAGRPV